MKDRFCLVERANFNGKRCVKLGRDEKGEPGRLAKSTTLGGLLGSTGPKYWVGHWGLGTLKSRRMIWSDSSSSHRQSSLNSKDYG